MRTPVLLLTLAAAACAPAVQSTTFTAQAATPRPADAPVPVFAEARPRCPFQEIGALRAYPRAPGQSANRVLAAMRERARRMGGDAIVGFTTEETRAEGASSATVTKGTVVRFTQPDCTE